MLLRSTSTWCRHDVRRLSEPYKTHAACLEGVMWVRGNAAGSTSMIRQRFIGYPRAPDGKPGRWHLPFCPVRRRRAADGHLARGCTQSPLPTPLCVTAVQLGEAKLIAQLVWLS